MKDDESQHSKLRPHDNDFILTYDVEKTVKKKEEKRKKAESNLIVSEFFVN